MVSGQTTRSIRFPCSRCASASEIVNRPKSSTSLSCRSRGQPILLSVVRFVCTARMRGPSIKALGVCCNLHAPYANENARIKSARAQPKIARRRSVGVRPPKIQTRRSIAAPPTQTTRKDAETAPPKSAICEIIRDSITGCPTLYQGYPSKITTSFNHSIAQTTIGASSANGSCRPIDPLRTRRKIQIPSGA